MTIEQLYTQHSDRIYQFIYFLVGQQQLAEDLTQDTYIKAMKGYSGFKGEASDVTWLMKIARNTVYDHFRRKKLVQFIPFTRNHEQIDTAYLPDAQLLKQEADAELLTALGKLPHHYKEAIILRKIESFTTKEAAKILGCNEAKVKNNLERGMKQLKVLLGGEDDA